MIQYDHEKLKHSFNKKLKILQFDTILNIEITIQWWIEIIIQYDQEKLKQINTMMTKSETTQKNWV
jgi:hypothetical protein